MIRYAYSRLKAVKYFFVGIFDSVNFWLRCDGHAFAAVSILFLLCAFLVAVYLKK